MSNPTDLYPDYAAMLTEAILALHKQERPKSEWRVFAELDDAYGATVTIWGYFDD